MASLARQERDDLLWIVGDTLRRDLLVLSRAPTRVEAYWFDSKRLSERWGSLEAAYNYAVDIARGHDCDMLVSLQDYIWAPPDGIARFEALAAEHPNALLSGLCSIADEPPASAITNPQGLYTIFAEPYTTKPEVRGEMGPGVQFGLDCRIDRVTDSQRQVQVEPIRYELNWAAIPAKALYDERLTFDERYDQGWAYGNQVFAQRAVELGYELWMDADNHAIGLPHKLYFPEEQAVLEEHNNRRMHELRRKISQ